MTNRAPCILSIAYDKSLLLTREWILKAAGFNVTSVLGFADAIAYCRSSAFDLVVMGHTVPRRDKQALVAEIRGHNHTRILSLRAFGEEPLPEADISVEASEGPDALISAVRSTLAKRSAPETGS